MSYLAKKELSATFSLAAILSIRMLGLFMILPIFTLYTNKLEGGTPFLIGLAIGIYGLTQALFQMPFGMLSDRIGRKQIIALGLFIFITGSLIAALSSNIYAIILGRALQGAGAIGSTLIAFIADFTRPQHRAKAMAIMGMTIGFSFAVAMILGPFFSSWIKLAGIFWVCAGLGLIGLLILFTLVPPAPKAVFHKEAEPVPAIFAAVLRSSQLLQLNLGICFLHIILTASFVALPILLSQLLGLKHEQLWYFYLVILLLAFLIMTPLIVIVEKKQLFKLALLSGIICIAIAELFFWKFTSSFLVISGTLLIFFTAFNLLEACLPSLVARIAPLNSRGTAMGIFSTFQYFGIFIGGALGGLFLQHMGLTSVFAFCVTVAILWLGFMVFSYRKSTKS